MSRLEHQRARRKIAELEYENNNLKKELETLKQENESLNQKLTRSGMTSKAADRSQASKVFCRLTR